MLNGIPKILSSDLLKLLMDMGHGDELVIGDGNFPAAAMGVPVVHLDGHGVPEVLEAILKFFSFGRLCCPACRIDGHHSRRYYRSNDMGKVQRKPPSVQVTRAGWKKWSGMLFYNRARRAFCVIATSEPAQYAEYYS